MAEETEKKGSSDNKKMIEEAREALKACIDEEDQERMKMLDDLRFCTLDQWPASIRNDREDASQDGGPRPCLTIDKINQYIVQVMNDMRQGKPGINVRPQDDSADVETAKILKGLIRNIEDQSNADIAYATGGESATKIGLGYWRVTTEYVAPDSNDQEIFIRPIPNTFAAYLGKHLMPDGSDAKEGFIIEQMPVEVFESKFPGKKTKPDEFDELGDEVDYWHTGESITVIERYWLERQNMDLLTLADGTTMYQRDYDKWPSEAGPKPGVTGKRSSYVEQLRWVKMTGIEVLDQRDLPCKYIPIIEMVGRETWIQGRRVLWGLVRPAKDSLRMYNYWASTITEKMGLAPKTPWVAAEGQIEGREQEWRDSNKKNRAVLQYKAAVDGSGNQLPPPQRMAAMPIEAAMIQQLQVIENDVRTALGIFKAGVGESESQQSGRAILALQRESDTGTYHFGANQGVSIRHTGRVILDMIPHYYDTKRIVRIIGEDGEVQTATIDPNQKTAFQKSGMAGMAGIFNPGLGKYDVSITVGPSYNTKRMEAAATLTEVVKSQPQLMPLIGDLLFRSLDFPYSDQIAERMKKMLPPPLQDQGDPGAKLMQAMAKMQQMGMQMQEMQQENLKLKAGEREGMAKVELARDEAAESLRLQEEKQNKEAKLARDKALDEFLLKQECDRRDCDHAKEIQDRKHALERERLDFEKQCHAEEKMADQQADNEVGAEKMAPKMIESMQAIVQEFAQIIAQQQAFQADIVAKMSEKKTITAKSSTGTTLTATVQ
jgi:hypothetical protein